MPIVDHFTRDATAAHAVGAPSGAMQRLGAWPRLSGKEAEEHPLVKALTDVSIFIEPGEVVGSNGQGNKEE